MGIFSLKIRIALLWVSVAIASVGSGLLEFRQEDLMGETFGQAFTGTAATNISPIYVLVPLVMAILTVSLKDKGNRWTNVVVGIIWAVSTIGFWVMVIMTKFVPLIIINLAAVAALVLICIYALRWPRYE